MSKVIGKVFDSYDDPAFTSHVYAKALFGEELIEPHELEKVADRDFAVKISEGRHTFRKFPTYNPTITKVSCAYFLDRKDSLPEDIEKSAGYHLKQACLQYGFNVPEELQGYDKAPFSVELRETPQEPGISSQQELSKTAETLLVNQFPRMTPEDRVAAAEHLSKVAEISDQRIWDYLPKDSYGPYFKRGICDRWELIKSAHEDGDPIWSTFRSILSNYSRTEPLRFAFELSHFDKLAGYRERYKEGLKDPYYICFAGFPMPSEEREREQEKIASLIEPRTLEGEPMSEEMSKKASVEMHEAALRKRFPKHSNLYKEAASIADSDVTSDYIKNKWGEAYFKARENHLKT